ncbi:MAG: hypothetical protein H6Q14_2235 [Bacteroidetes bacterium]|jgi:hypothetical protein|nr:hypothetical protein [Bacteroidota bacterium]
MLKYNLLDNPLTERPDDYAAQTSMGVGCVRKRSA